MKLITGNINYSSWSARAWMALRFCGIEFEHETIPLFQEGFRDSLLKISPSGMVPVLQHEDLTLWDSLSIIEYLYDRDPGCGLYPKDPKLRALARSAVCEMHSGFIAIRNVLPMNIRASGLRAKTSDELRAEVRRIEDLWETAKSLPHPVGPGLFGPFSAADIFFVPVAFRFATYNIGLRSNACDYVKTLLGWPLVRELSEIAKNEPWNIDFIDVC